MQIKITHKRHRLLKRKREKRLSLQQAHSSSDCCRIYRKISQPVASAVSLRSVLKEMPLNRIDYNSSSRKTSVERHFLTRGSHALLVAQQMYSRPAKDLSWMLVVTMGDIVFLQIWQVVVKLTENTCITIQMRLHKLKCTGEGWKVSTYHFSRYTNGRSCACIRFFI